MNTAVATPFYSRAGLRQFLKSNRWERIIMTLIILNAITLGMQTSRSMMASYGFWLEWFDAIVLSIFVAELLARLYAFGWSFWKDPWAIFDLIIVSIALYPASENMSVLRSLRILRVLRLISAVKSMRKVVDGLLAALPGMGSVMALMSIIFYVFAVMATNLFRDISPDKFGSLGESTFTLFQIMTLESWAEGVVRPVMAQAPWAWVFFIIFILLTSFAVLNLFIGIIVDAMQQDVVEETMEVERKQHEETLAKLETVMSELKEIKTELTKLKG